MTLNDTQAYDRITQICFLSGKGGTGKTTLCAAFASIEDNAVLVDADVESSNLPLMIPHQVLNREPFAGRRLAVIDPSLCIRCGRCIGQCAFGAIVPEASGVPRLIPSLCEGCRICERICPASAITMHETEGGEWCVSGTALGPLVHASLEPAEESSGRLVRILRMMAESLALQGGYRTILIDGPAGLGCPAISSLTGADAVIVVTEPTAAALSDMERILDLTAHFAIPACLCINKSTMEMTVTREIERRCRERKIVLAGALPYDDAFRDALTGGVPLVHIPHRQELAVIWSTIRTFVKGL